MDSIILWINLYPLNSTIGFPNIYPLDSHLIRWIPLSSFWTTGAWWMSAGESLLRIYCCKNLLNLKAISFKVFFFQNSAEMRNKRLSCQITRGHILNSNLQGKDCHPPLQFFSHQPLKRRNSLFSGPTGSSLPTSLIIPSKLRLSSTSLKITFFISSIELRLAYLNPWFLSRHKKSNNFVNWVPLLLPGRSNQLNIKVSRDDRADEFWKGCVDACRCIGCVKDVLT